MSCLSDDFHKAVHYGKKILNAQEYISLTDAKIDEANRAAEAEAQEWNKFSSAESAFNLYQTVDYIQQNKQSASSYAEYSTMFQ